MEFNFDQLKEIVEHYKTKYDGLMESLDEDTIHLEITPFTHYQNDAIPKLFATDGSFITYWKSPFEKFYIGGVRVAFLEEFFDGNKYVDNGGASNEFVFMNLEQQERRIGLKKRITMENPRSVLGYIMSLREKQKLIEYASEHQNQIIMVDGSIIESFSIMTAENRDHYIDIIGEEKFTEIHERSSMDELVDVCKKNHHILVGATKDSGIKLNNKIRYEVVLENAIRSQNLDPKGMYYYTLPKDSPHFNKKRRVDEFEVLFTKLHPKAIKWHRLDIMISEYDINTEILPLLSLYSQYTHYLGTPRPPQVCDGVANEINSRKMSTLKKIREIMLEKGYTFADIYYGETDITGEKLSHIRKAHDRLDQVNRTDRTDRTDRTYQVSD